MTREPEPLPEPLDELREDWHALEPPAPVRALEEEDAETRAAVDWMRGAWDALGAPEPGPVPVCLTRTLAAPAAPRLGLAPRIALALAAGLVAWFGFALSRPAGDRVAPAEPPLELAAVEPSASREGPELLEAPIVLAANEERIELRSGAVRLVLLRPLATDASGTPR